MLFTFEEIKLGNLPFEKELKTWLGLKVAKTLVESWEMNEQLSISQMESKSKILLLAVTGKNFDF